MTEEHPGAHAPMSISVVVPVYGGERTLDALVEELLPLTAPSSTPHGQPFVVDEVLLVHDNGPDRSDVVIRRLAAQFDFVRPIWLSRNFGQHAATLAGMASSGGEWIVTMDEDGQHNPADIGALLDAALETNSCVVYADPTNAKPHGFLRNAASSTAKRAIRSVSGVDHVTDFESYRLVLGEIGRSVAAYAGAGVYLDIAISWVTDRVTTCPVTLRAEADRPSGYSLSSLVGHFSRMLLSSGTRGLRLVSLIGVVAALCGLALAIFFLVQRLFFTTDLPAGWSSTMVVLLVGFGALLFSLGVVAEYVGVNVNMAMGRPLYLITTDPAQGPLGRVRTAPEESTTESRD